MLVYQRVNYILSTIFLVHLGIVSLHVVGISQLAGANHPWPVLAMFLGYQDRAMIITKPVTLNGTLNHQADKLRKSEYTVSPILSQCYHVGVL